MRILISVVFFALLTQIGLDTVAQQNKESYLILSARAIKIQETNTDEDSHIYHIVNYEVISVCKGIFKEDTIRVAHIVGTAKNLKVGDIACLKLKKTNEFRRMAEDLLETGIYMPEEFIADYVYAGYQQPCSCSVPK